MTNTMQYVLPRLLTGIFLALFHAWPFILLNDPLVGEGKNPKSPNTRRFRALHSFSA